MLLRLFRKTREVTDPTHLLWVRYFTVRPDLDALSAFPHICSLVTPLANRPFSKHSINQRFEIPNDKFLPEYFEFDRPIDPSLLDLVACVEAEFFELRENAAVVGVIVPLLMQYAIKWIRFFLPSLEIALKSCEARAEFGLKEAGKLFEMCDRFPKEYRADVLAVWAPVFGLLANALERESGGVGVSSVAMLCSTIVQLTTSANDGAELCENDLPMLRFLVAYYTYWAVRLSEPTVPTSTFQNCFFVLKMLINMPRGLAGNFSNVLVEPIVSAGFIVLTLAFTSTQGEYDVFLLCNGFLGFLRFAVSMEETASQVWEHAMLHFLGYFVAWVVDRFRIIQFERSNAFDEEERLVFDFEESEISERYRFWGIDTFAPGAMDDIQGEEVHYGIEPLSPLIASNNVVSSLMTNLVGFSSAPGSEPFVKLFLDTALTFLNPLAVAQLHQVPIVSERWVIASSLCLFTLSYLARLPDEIILLARPDFSKLVMSYVFAGENIWWTADPKASDLRFFRLLRAAVFLFSLRCFGAPGDLAFDLVKEFAKFAENAKPQAADEVVLFITTILRSNPTVFASILPSSGVVTSITRIVGRYERCHLHLIRSENSRYATLIARARIHIFFLVELLWELDGTFVLQHKLMVEALFRMLFESSVQDFALKVISRAFTRRHVDPRDYDVILGQVRELFREALLHPNDAQWIHLILHFMAKMENTILKNGDLLSDMTHFNFLVDMSCLPAIGVSPGDRIVLINQVLRCYCSVSTISSSFRQRLTVLPMKNVSELGCGLEFGTETVSLLLQLVFMVDLHFDNLPETGEIVNAKMLRYVHEMTNHLASHSALFSFIDRVCENSQTNRLRVFRSKFLVCILKYIQSFPRRPEPQTHDYESVMVLLRVFQTVSASVFSSKIYFELISTMRPRDGHRPWWNSLLVALIPTLISRASSVETISSFFHFSRERSQLVLPTGISGELFNGLTFFAIFQLGQQDTVLFEPCLFSLRTSTGQILTIALPHSRTMVIQFGEPNDPEIISPSLTLFRDVWYRLAVSFQKKMCFVYANGREFASCPLKRRFQLTQKITGGVVGNSIDGNSPLKFNLSCVHLFGTSFSPDLLVKMSSLPDDFVNTFSPASLSLYPDLKGKALQLFTEAIESRQLCCFNARVAENTTAVNLAPQSLGNAVFEGEVIPFCSSFCEVTENFGGLIPFFPLFRQVDLPASSEAPRAFLGSLFSLFWSICRSRVEIERDFFQSDGVKCLAHLLSIVNPASLQPSVIDQLATVLADCRDRGYASIMLDDLWLNFPLWCVHKPANRCYVYKKLDEFIQDSSIGNLFLSFASVPFFMTLAIREANLECSSRLWSLTGHLARRRFTSEEQQTSLAIGLAIRQVAALQPLLILLQERVHGFHKAVEVAGGYTPFLQLLHHSNEEVRVVAFDFLLEVFNLHCANLINSPISLRPALLSAVSLFNPANHSCQLWDRVLTAFFVATKGASDLFPFLCFLAAFHPIENGASFLRQLAERVSIEDDPLSGSILQCPFWYFWLFFLFTQTHEQDLDFLAEHHNLILIYAILCSHLLLSGRKADYYDVVSFWSVLTVAARWDLSVIVRDFFSGLLCRLSKAPEDAIVPVVGDILVFLFYQTNLESSFVNSELLATCRYVYRSRLQTRIPARIPLADFCAFFGEVSLDGLIDLHFSTRTLQSGDWLDMPLAVMLVHFFCTFETSATFSIPFCDVKLRCCDLTAFLLGYILRSSPAGSRGCLDLFIACIEPLNDSVSCQLFLTQLHYTAVLHSPLRAELGKHAPATAFEKTAQFFTMLADQCPTVLSQKRQRMQATIHKAKDMLRCLIPPSENMGIGTVCAEALHAGDDALERKRALTEKSYKRIFRELSTNGGPWCVSGNEEHWKARNMFDSSFRRIYVKLNLRFDIHKDASLLRDEASKRSAQEKFALWRAVSSSFVRSDLPEQYKVEIELSSADYEFSVQAVLVTPMSTVSPRKDLTGTFYMNNQEICFNVHKSKSLRLLLREIECVFLRSYLHLDTGLEILLVSHRSYFFDFLNQDRQRVLTKLSRMNLPNITVLQTNHTKDWVSAYTEQWQNGQLSNYEYLMLVNFLAGRSFNDLSQYPVFPWVLSNYESATIDLSNSANYRDLGAPLGTLNTARFEKLAAMLDELPPDDPDKFTFFRQHYSNPFYVCLYLLRMEPFASIHIALCDQKFDKADRLFASIGKSYDCVTGGLADFRELIPEFFSIPEFLLNSNDFDLGIGEGCEPVGDVVLPPWAHGSPHEFVAIHRQALESPWVSLHLPEWIDLIFGYKQNGQAAIDARNTFHRSCYQSSVTPDVLSDPLLLTEIQEVARNVGIVPRQLFDHAHPLKTVIAMIPAFDIYRLEFFCTFGSVPRSVSLTGNQLYLVDSDCAMWSLRLVRPVSQLLHIGSVHPYVTNRAETLPRSFLLLPDVGRFVAASSWDGAFHVFNIDSGYLSHINSVRQKSSFLSTLTSAGGSRLLTSWRDSSIRLSDLSVPGMRYTYRITPHLTSIVDIAASPISRMIASVDKSRRCVLSMLYTGKYIRAFIIDGSDILERVLLFANGFITVLSKIELPDVKKAIVRVYGIDARKLAEVEFDDTVLDWAQAEFDCALDALVLSFESKRLAVLRIPDLWLMYDATAEMQLVTLVFWKAMDGILALSRDGTIYTLAPGT
jgi:hypothetical protein